MISVPSAPRSKKPREHDTADRRRVIVRLNQEAHDAKILPLYAAKAPGAASVLAGFTDEQLATVAAFLRALADETDENGATG